jgi:foldase protein PrsA
VEYTDDEKAQLSDTAAAIAASDDFDTAVTDAGYTVSTATYGSAEDEDAQLDTEVLEAADNLKEGEVSGVVETDSAYYVVRLDSECDEDATATKKEEMISEKQEDYYDDIVDGWKDEVTWTLNEKEWNKVTFDKHFTDTESLTDTESVSDTEILLDTE